MSKGRRQFSIRALLVLTALISAVLAFAVRLPDVFRILLIIAALVLVIVAIFQSANYATSDRRPRLAFLSWIALGVFFSLFSLAIFRMMTAIGGELETMPIILLCVMLGCASTCAIRAVGSLLMIASPSTDSCAASKIPPASPVEPPAMQSR